MIDILGKFIRPVIALSKFLITDAENRMRISVTGENANIVMARTCAAPIRIWMKSMM